MVIIYGWGLVQLGGGKLCKQYKPSGGGRISVQRHLKPNLRQQKYILKIFAAAGAAHIFQYITFIFQLCTFRINQSTYDSWLQWQLTNIIPYIIHIRHAGYHVKQLSRITRMTRCLVEISTVNSCLKGSLALCLAAARSAGGLLETPTRWHAAIYTSLIHEGGKISVHSFRVGSQKRSARLWRRANFECARLSDLHRPPPINNDPSLNKLI